jgi:hypothetical protein
MKRLLVGTLWAVIWWAACFGEVDPEAAAETAGAKYFTVPMAEIVNTPLYLATTEYNELVVRYAGSGSDLVRDDYITHADSILLLTGGLDSFLASGEKEVVVPVVDDADEQHADALRGLSDEANRTLGRAEELAEALGSVYGHARFGDVEGGSTTAARGMATPRSARSTAQGRERAFSPD